MTDDEMKLIADAHGWQANGEKHAAYCDTEWLFTEFAINDKSWGKGEWHLTPAGAWTVLVTTPQASFKTTSPWGDGWRVNSHPPVPNPIHAVEQAELARLKDV